MKDHEIIAILENCDDAQRARILAWAKARWEAGSSPDPTHAPPSQPIREEVVKKFLEQPIREEVIKEFLKRIRDAQGPLRPPPQVIPMGPSVLPGPPRDPMRPDWTYPFWCAAQKSVD